ncbi:hypothetical protein [Bacillus cereus]|nr:hypothetical protein [Bacillus cereus]
MDILDILDKVSGISSFILAIYILLKESKEEKNKRPQRKGSSRPSRKPKRRKRKSPNGKLNQLVGFPKKNIIISHIYMSKTSLILNTICLFLTIRFFIVTDFPNLQMLDTIYLIVIILWILVFTISIIKKFKK